MSKKKRKSKLRTHVGPLTTVAGSRDQILALTVAALSDRLNALPEDVHTVIVPFAMSGILFTS